MKRLKPPINAAVVGLGMGRHHIGQIQQTEGLALTAICDIDKKRLATAKADLGDEIKTYSDVGKLARDKDVQLVVVATPHNAHASVAAPLLRAGKHCVVEKPFAITIKECDRMIDAAAKAGVTLSVYHNRRWDGDFLTLKGLIDAGWIGDVFHVEMCGGGYSAPGTSWRSVKKICGGGFYDWGAHYVDWVLNIVPGAMKTVTGQFQVSPIWKTATIEDHCEAYVRFNCGAVAHVQRSTIQAAPKPKWYVLGTKGAIVDNGGEFAVYSRVKGRTVTFNAAYEESRWLDYYRQMADHLSKGEPVPVTPQSARRAIAVIELAEKASNTGKEQRVPYEKVRA